MLPLQSETPFPEIIADLLGLDISEPWVISVTAVVAAGVIATVLLTMTAVLGIWGKRKITAAFTDRIAVNRHGPYGLLIIPADAVRLLSKELIVPEAVDRPAWDLAPLIIASSALLGFAVIPFGHGLQLADPETGLAYVFAVASIASLGLLMAGYASNNKFSFLGGLRAVAQNLAYEIPLVITGASVVIFAGSLRMSTIVEMQQQTLVSLAGIPIPSWYVFVNPFAFVLFMIANLAEVGRNPFDIPEAPTEIVAGYQTEYSSVYFVLIYLGEFIHIFLGGPAEKQRGDDGAAEEDVDELPEVDQDEVDAGVLGLVAGDDLRRRLRDVEGVAADLHQVRDHEQHEREGVDEGVPRRDGDAGDRK